MSFKAAAWIGMKLKRKPTWNVAKENFGDDKETNAQISRQARKPEYDLNLVMKKVGLA